MDDFQYGRRELNERGYDRCCHKPGGCTNQTAGCLWPNHPHKRLARGEITLDQLNEMLLGGDANDA